MKKVILIVVSLALLLMPIVACEPSSEPKPFPPPEGYSSWDEYYEEYYKEASPSPAPTPTPNPTPEPIPEPIPPLPEPAPEELDTTPPVISGVNISHITESSATIKWETDELVTSFVEYGRSDAYGSIKTLTVSHSVTLTELETETTYHFRVKLVDEAGNEALSKDYDFTTKTVKELLSAMLYSSITIGGRVHQLSFNLFNSSSQTITVTKVEIFDEQGDVTFTMSKSDIAETWGSGEVDASKSLSAGISFGIPPSTKEIEDWQVKWYCIDANGVEFVVTGEYSPLP